ncbi:MAG: 6-bladed beta-propeller [Gammaproteobacteria bacterium]|jgi:DNA-binding beta-propeller fold protein YncE|nr:6-bladed beta-propeller [Gammaproteobacteria bacterium]MDH3846338.1 6-bladed beta-propeller [Gammaproteobacteria bacterium]MDH3864647.1 6-bladed beta-propeller [Gammaproteobacteria bacterium]MDH4005934.1 6-bladed beta-propeller [Gammaproteobacteria bacterium]NCF59365.1 6-bladed beta-propeller [Gammaproteobacteria bacterium]
MRGVGVGFILGLLSGCAAAPVEMVYFPEDRAPETRLVWPGPPETPRLAYAGELIGEENFRAVDGERDGAALRVLRWIAGIGRGDEDTRELIRPQSGMVDEFGRILITDAGREAVVVFDEVSGALSFWQEAERGGSFRSPVGIASDGVGGYLVADADIGYLVRLNVDGDPAGSIGEGVLERPTGLCRSEISGEIFVADSSAHDIKVFDTSGRLLRRIGGRGLDAGSFNGPTHLSCSGDRLYVTDTLNARVQALSLAGEPQASIGKRGLFVGNLVRPKGVVTDLDGHVYIVESYYDHVLVFNESGDLLLPIGGTGSEAGQFFLPAGAWTDDGRRLFVADMFNGRVVVFDYLGGGS